MNLKEEGDSPWDYMTQFWERKAENPDFIGWIKFDSGIVNEPIVQAKDDNKYLRHDFYGNYSVNGTVYMEASHTFDSRNITLYGHYIYADPNLMFTQLEQLREQENYEQNKIFRLYLEDEVRVYEVAAVIDYYAYAGAFHYTYEKYNDEQWQDFLNYMKEKRLYDTGVEITDDGQYVTLQTCVRNQKSRRTIVIGKMIQQYLKKGES